MIVAGECIDVSDSMDKELLSVTEDVKEKQRRNGWTGTKAGSTAYKVALVGLMVAFIEVCKIVMMNIPNVEMTTFLLIMFTLFFGKLVLFVVPVFILIEGVMFGFGLWWIMYLYVWPLLVLVTWLLRKQESVWVWSLVAGAFGLLYGFFCSFPYFFIGAVDGGFMGGFSMAFSWWIAGIPWDLVHGASNFVFMLALYKPMRRILLRTSEIL